MKYILGLPLALCWLVSIWSTPVGATEWVGLIKTFEGSAVVQRQGQSIAVVLGSEILPGDIVRTGADSALGLIFKDDTVVSLGPRTEFAIDAYLFNPREGQLSFIARVIRGTLSFLSGQMTQLSPESVRLEFPAGTIGVRGTHVLIKAP